MSATPPAAATSPATTVGEVMRNPAITIGPDAHVASAAYLMRRTPCGALVVTTEGDPPSPVAILTESDVSRAVADGLDVEDTRINQLRLPRPHPVAPTTPVAEAAGRMLAEGITHLPVVEGGRLVGLLDIVAVCRVLLPEAAPASPAD